jgi:hypothetical protein
MFTAEQREAQRLADEAMNQVRIDEDAALAHGMGYEEYLIFKANNDPQKILDELGFGSGIPTEPLEPASPAAKVPAAPDRCKVCSIRIPEEARAAGDFSWCPSPECPGKSAVPASSPGSSDAEVTR